MKFRKNFDNNRWMQNTATACIAVVVFVALINLGGVLGGVREFFGLISPILYGVVIAYMISPLVGFLQKTLFRKIRGSNLNLQLSNIMAIVIVAILIVWIMSTLIPQIFASISMFISNINNYAEALRAISLYLVEKGGEYNLDLSILNQSTSDVLNTFVSFITNNASSIAARSLNATGIAVNLGIGVILAIYFLVYKTSILSSVRRAMAAVMDDDHYAASLKFLGECNRITKTYVVSDILDALIISLINAVFMMVTDMPYIMIISLVIGVFNLIPTFGPFIGAFFAGMILLLASPHQVVLFLIFTYCLQMVDGYIIKPKLFGDALGVSGVWITVGIIVGANLFGFLGMLLAVPIVAIINHIMLGYLEKREAEKKVPASGPANDKDG